MAAVSYTHLDHKIMVPYGISGEVVKIHKGAAKLEEMCIRDSRGGGLSGPGTCRRH